MKLSIRKTVVGDIPTILEIYELSRGIMRSDGNYQQWSNGYPNKDSLKNDIDKGVGYVIIDDDNGTIVASFAFIIGKDPTYSEIYDGEWLDDTSPYGTIHRIGSRPEIHGIAQTCFDWCSKRIKNLRIDTHKDNRIMQHVILKAGFQYCGIIHLLNGDPRLAYQKIYQI